MTGRMGIMGSMPRLKIKDEIRYRKGSTCDAENCECCLNFKNMEPDCAVPSRAYGTCRLIRDWLCYGIPCFNRRTRVRADYRCDRQEYDGRYRSVAPASRTEDGKG